MIIQIVSIVLLLALLSSQLSALSAALFHQIAFAAMSSSRRMRMDLPASESDFDKWIRFKWQLLARRWLFEL